MRTFAKILLGLSTAAVVLLGFEILLGMTRGLWDEHADAPSFRVLKNNSDPDAVTSDAVRTRRILSAALKVPETRPPV